jgi:hypothetical protein
MRSPVIPIKMKKKMNIEHREAITARHRGGVIGNECNVLQHFAARNSQNAKNAC